MKLFKTRYIYIVIDDYHLIKIPVIHHMMAHFIDYLPRNTFVYLTSRIVPPLPLAKWRVKEWLTEIGVERYYSKRHLNYGTTQSLQRIFQKTEGWAAGIQLAGLAGQSLTEENDKEFEKNYPFVTEFLLEEVLVSLSPTEQDFLLRTSIICQCRNAHLVCNCISESISNGKGE